MVTQRKGTKSGADRDSHSGKNCHHFCALRPEQHMAAQLTNIIFSSFFFHFTCTFHSWNIKTSHKVPVNPLAPPHPSLGMCCSPGSSGPAVRGLRPVEQLMVRVHLLFPSLHQEGPTLRIFGQNCLYVRKFTVYWLQSKPSVTLHPRAFPSPKSDVFCKATILTDCHSKGPSSSPRHIHGPLMTPH